MFTVKRSVKLRQNAKRPGRLVEVSYHNMILLPVCLAVRLSPFSIILGNITRYRLGYYRTLIGSHTLFISNSMYISQVPVLVPVFFTSLKVTVFFHISLFFNCHLSQSHSFLAGLVFWHNLFCFQH